MNVSATISYSLNFINGRFRYGDVSQHRAGTCKNTSFCFPLPVSARCSWWQVTFVNHFRCQYNIIRWLGHVHRRFNDSFAQNTSHKHISIVNQCLYRVQRCYRSMLLVYFVRTRVHFLNYLVDSNANELTKFGKSLSHFNLENEKKK